MLRSGRCSTTSLVSTLSTTQSARSFCEMGELCGARVMVVGDNMSEFVTEKNYDYLFEADKVVN